MFGPCHCHFVIRIVTVIWREYCIQAFSHRVPTGHVTIAPGVNLMQRQDICHSRSSLSSNIAERIAASSTFLHAPKNNIVCVTRVPQ